MNTIPASSRQPHREPWTHERLVHERSVALGTAIEPSTASSYSSALHSYVTFCTMHQFSIEPTVDTLTFFIVYMCAHIKPTSVEAYLSGICNQLEGLYPHIRELRHHRVVSKTLTGCKKLRAVGVTRKRALTRLELAEVSTRYADSSDHDDKLFAAMLLGGFHALHRLGEIAWPDKKDLQDYRKVVLRHTVSVFSRSYKYVLPSHKADRLFASSEVIVQKTATTDDPHFAFSRYLDSRDHLYPFHPELWLRANGTVPTRRWFIRRLHSHFPDNVGGHSLRAGGATAYAEAGVPPHLIQAIGRWSSMAFQLYIRHHPVLLAALLFSHSSNF
jgi:hypothetical protein